MSCAPAPLLLGMPGGIHGETGEVILPPEPLSPGYGDLAPLTSVRGGQRTPASATAWSSTMWEDRTRNQYNLIDHGLLRAMPSILPCRVSSILDFGSGGGHWSAALRRVLGASRVIGVEPRNMTSVGFFANAEDAGPVQSLADFATYDYRPDSRPFDLVWSTEALEHIPYEAHCRILNSLALSARRWLIFSAGDSWRGGHGNAGPRPVLDWRMHWLSRGYRLDLKRTCSMRAAAKFGWFKEGIGVYERAAPCDLACSSRRCATRLFAGEQIARGGPEDRTNQDRLLVERMCQ